MTEWLAGAKRAADDHQHDIAQTHALIAIAETLVALVGLIELTSVEPGD
jgi:hypothetical protein